jgi:hypothetical protein
VRRSDGSWKFLKFLRTAAPFVVQRRCAVLGVQLLTEPRPPTCMDPCMKQLSSQLQALALYQEFSNNLIDEVQKRVLKEMISDCFQICSNCVDGIDMSG